MIDRLCEAKMVGGKHVNSAFARELRDTLKIPEGGANG